VPVRVVIADDSLLVREGLEQVLAGQPGIEVVGSYADLPSLLEAIEADPPDVVLTDIGMAQNDGFDLIKRIRQSSDAAVREVPAAALTAYARAEDRMKVLQAGFQMHLAKPVDPAELIVAVAALAKRTGRLE